MENKNALCIRFLVTPFAKANAAPTNLFSAQLPYNKRFDLARVAVTSLAYAIAAPVRQRRFCFAGASLPQACSSIERYTESGPDQNSENISDLVSGDSQF